MARFSAARFPPSLSQFSTVGGFDSRLVELLLRVLVGIAEEVNFEVDDGFENLAVDFAGDFKGKTFVLIGDWSEVFSTSDLTIGFTFKGVSHADSDSVEDLGGSSAVSLNSGVLEGLFDNVDNFG